MPLAKVVSPMSEMFFLHAIQGKDTSNQWFCTIFQKYFPFCWAANFFFEPMLWSLSLNMGFLYAIQAKDALSKCYCTIGLQFLSA